MNWKDLTAYYNPYTGSFRVLGNTVYYYYYGVSNTLESPMIFAWNFNDGVILQRSKETSEERMPVDRYGTKLIVSWPEQIRNRSGTAFLCHRRISELLRNEIL